MDAMRYIYIYTFLVRKRGQPPPLWVFWSTNQILAPGVAMVSCHCRRPWRSCITVEEMVATLQVYEHAMWWRNFVKKRKSKQLFEFQRSTNTSESIDISLFKFHDIPFSCHCKDPKLNDDNGLAFEVVEFLENTQLVNIWRCHTQTSTLADGKEHEHSHTLKLWKPEDIKPHLLMNVFWGVQSWHLLNFWCEVRPSQGTKDWLTSRHETLSL